jgi:large subunit ribosomal protein L10
VNREEKQQQMESLRQEFAAARAAFLVEFQGLTVARDTELRNRLRRAAVRYRVVKNRLARRAVEDTPLAALDGQFRGPTAVALSQGDPAAAAKLLVEFARDNPALRIKAGLLEGGQRLDAAGVEALSRLPGLPVLRGRLAGVVLAPATRLAMVLSEPARALARVLDARREQLAGSGGGTEA